MRQQRPKILHAGVKKVGIPCWATHLNTFILIFWYYYFASKGIIHSFDPWGGSQGLSRLENKKQRLNIELQSQRQRVWGAPGAPPDPPQSVLASVLELERKQEAAKKKTNIINLLKICLSYNTEEFLRDKTRSLGGLAMLK